MLDIAAIQIMMTPLVEGSIFFYNSAMVQDWRRVIIQRFDLKYMLICKVTGRRLRRYTNVTSDQNV